MIRMLQKLLPVLLCLLLCLAVLPACTKEADPWAVDAIESLTPDQNGNLVAKLTLSSRTAEKHAGETVSLYELLPGETLSDIGGKEPIAEKKIKQSLELSFPLFDGERTRLYSSFAAVFEDGTTLIPSPRAVSAPERLAENTAAFGWTGSQKGICLAEPEDALALGVMHIMYEVRLSELTAGSDRFSFHGTDYAVSNTVLNTLERDITAAANAGMQVSLTVIPDTAVYIENAVAMLDLLASRFAGKVSAFVIGTDPVCTPADAAMLCRVSSLALRSRMAHARVYVCAPIGTVAEVKAYYKDVLFSLSAGGTVEWDAMLTPSPNTGDNKEAPLMVPSDLSELSEYLLNESGDGHAVRIAVRLPDFSAKNPELQATQLVLAYRLSLVAGATLIYANTLFDDDFGLCTANRERRLAADMFATLDTGISQEHEQLCMDIAGQAWDLVKTSSIVSRKNVSGIANVGTTGFAEDPLFDFNEGDPLGFTAVSASSTPEVVASTALKNTSVLRTFSDPTALHAGGVRKILHDPSALAGATSLSVYLLTQAERDTISSCTARLSLEGFSTEGVRLSYSSQISFSNREWQVISFQISSFTASLDTSRPCTLTLTTSPDGETEQEYALMLRGMDLHRPAKAPNTSATVLALALGGVSLSFAIFLTVYLLSAKRRKNRR